MVPGPYLPPKTTAKTRKQDVSKNNFSASGASKQAPGRKRKGAKEDVLHSAKLARVSKSDDIENSPRTKIPDSQGSEVKSTKEKGGKPRTPNKKIGDSRIRLND